MNVTVNGNYSSFVVGYGEANNTVTITSVSVNAASAGYCSNAVGGVIGKYMTGRTTITTATINGYM